MTSIRQTNSWHWLVISIVICLLVGGFLGHATWKKQSQKNGRAMQSMVAHADQLKLLQVEDALLLEHQASELQKQLHAYNEAVRKQAGKPIPADEQEALALSNEISRALIEHQLRIVEQEQTREEPEAEEVRRPVSTPEVPLEMRRAAAARAAAVTQATKEKAKESLPYSTREIRYVLEGEYKHMFMFLVRQSHEKPSYHFKDIKILPSPHQAGMRMEFIVQIHYNS